MTKNNTFQISEIFASLQGEGQFAGMPVIFVRFAGCDLECAFCDEGGMLGSNPHPAKMTAADIVTRCEDLANSLYPNIVLTGGEPTMHLRNKEATAELQLALSGCHVAIETNGHFPVPPWVDWVTWSPKDDMIHHRLAPNEIKMLMDSDGDVYGDMTPQETQAFAETVSEGTDAPPPVLFMQALTYDDQTDSDLSVQHALAFVRENKAWRLGQRLHVQLGLK